MEISGQRIRNLDRHLGAVAADAPVVIALSEIAEHEARLREIGFSDDLPLGETVLPLPVGTVSHYNAEGDYIVHRDRPKETRYRQMEWTWEEWHGPYNRVERSRIVDVPYEAYPRTFRPPPGIELTIAEAATGAKAIVTPALAYSTENKSALLHRVNLLLELFGRATLLTGDLEPYLRTEVRRYNWDVLPPGEMPWPQLQERLGPILDEFGERKRPVAEHRLRTFTETYPSDFTAVGRAGFRGYLVFGYQEQSIYVVESLQYGNATYVFGEDWEQLSRMNKAEILNQDLQQDRIIHNEDWSCKIQDMLG
jgi:hypothetical protein